MSDGHSDFFVYICDYTVYYFLFMRSICIFLSLALLLSSCGGNTQDVTITFEDSPRVLSESYFQLGTAVTPDGQTLFVNDQSLVLNGKNILPVMGEFHYSRYPENEWRNELLKMKAGGINIIATYVFWIHHEELKRQYDWTGQRNLRKFVEICDELGLPIVLRIGPWAHGECRNGGFPEWMVQSGLRLRSNDSRYLAEVDRWYRQIATQVKGLMWKDGGPIIGVQLDNEYRGPGSHLENLKAIAVKHGFDLPIYTRTGWPNLTGPITYGEILPLYGDYVDGFWDRTLDEMPGDYPKCYIFRAFRNSTVIATEQLPEGSSKDTAEDMKYPYFTCELGGGMLPSYHRRISIAPMDIYSMLLVKLGSGSNLPGYYMYHGGTNPESKQTYLNEMQATLMTNYNDLPMKTYDYQAPLGEFGQSSPHYHMLRRLHLFLADFGSEMTTMPSMLPDQYSPDAQCDSLVRWSVRTNGRNGYIFVNNYQRLKDLSEKEDVRFNLNLPEGLLQVPSKPMDIPAGSSFIIPFNFEVGDANIIYALAQPIAKVDSDNESVYAFMSIEGIEPEFVFADGAKVVKNKKNTGLEPRYTINNEDGSVCHILVLSPEESLKLWKGEVAGRQRFVFSDAELSFDNGNINMTDTSGDVTVSVYPPLKSLSLYNNSLGAQYGSLFSHYNVSMILAEPRVSTLQIKEYSQPLREITIGIAGAAEEPRDGDFEKASEWEILLPDNLTAENDVLLNISYTGDVARVYLGDKFLTDNFYNGKPMVLGLKRYAPEIYEQPLTIKILPLQPVEGLIYLPVEGLEIPETGLCTLNDISVVHQNTVTLVAE